MEGISILAVSHGGMAEGMVRAVRMVAGNIGSLDYLCLDEECSIEEFKGRLLQKLQGLAGAEQILVLADIQGGSPYTASVELLAREGLLDKAYIVAGMNLPLLLTVVFQAQPLSKEALLALIAEAQGSMKLFETESDEDDEL